MHNCATMSMIIHENASLCIIEKIHIFLHGQLCNTEHDRTRSCIIMYGCKIVKNIKFFFLAQSHNNENYHALSCMDVNQREKNTSSLQA